MASKSISKAGVGRSVTFTPGFTAIPFFRHTCARPIPLIGAMIAFSQMLLLVRAAMCRRSFAKLCPWIAASFLYVICENALSLLCAEALPEFRPSYSPSQQASLHGGKYR